MAGDEASKEMIVAKEKYKDTYIIYIDDSIERVEDFPKDYIADLLDQAFEHMSRTMSVLEGNLPEILE